MEGIMRELVERVIDDNTYIFHQLPVSLSLKILIRITKIIGPTLGSVFDGLGKDFPDTMKELMGADLEFSKITNTIFSSIDEEITVSTIKELLSKTIVDGKNLSDVFEVHFQRNHLHLLKVIKSGLEVEYGNFLGDGGLASVILQANKENMEKSTTQEKQTVSG